MVDSVSDKTTLKWLEQLLIPVLVAGFLSLSTCAVRSNESITKLEASSAESLKARGKAENALESLSKQQTTLQIQVNTVSTHQEHIIKDIETLKSELKEQNNSILEAIKALDK